MSRPDPAALVIGGTVWLWAAALAIAAIAARSLPLALAAGTLTLLGAGVAMLWRVPLRDENGGDIEALIDATRETIPDYVPDWMTKEHK